MVSWVLGQNQPSPCLPLLYFLNSLASLTSRTNLSALLLFSLANGTQMPAAQQNPVWRRFDLLWLGLVWLCVCAVRAATMARAQRCVEQGHSGGGSARPDGSTRAEKSKVGVTATGWLGLGQVWHGQGEGTTWHG